MKVRLNKEEYELSELQFKYLKENCNKILKESFGTQVAVSLGTTLIGYASAKVIDRIIQELKPKEPHERTYRF